MNIGLAIYELLQAGLCGALVLAAGILPALLVCRMERRRREDPEYLRRVGVVVRSVTALDDTADIVGRYMNATIYAQVIFKGIVYRFDRVAPAAYKQALRPAELFLEPGIVYVAR
ncbi:MAG TPA: hypothetical protein VLW45_06430 [Pelomicrobium sp.]|nr:hypothetical protein [Pelomicrobium sp.]